MIQAIKIVLIAFLIANGLFAILQLIAVTVTPLRINEIEFRIKLLWIGAAMIGIALLLVIIAGIVYFKNRKNENEKE